MQKLRVVISICLVACLFGCGSDNDNGGAPPTATSAPPATFTHTASPAPTQTATATHTASPSSTATATPAPTPTTTTVEAGAIALFSADALDPANPFPSDRLLDDTGQVSVTGALIGADLPPTAQFDTARSLANVVADQLRVLTGFSTFAPIRVKFDGPVAVSSLTDPDGILLLAYDDLSLRLPVRAATVTPEISGDFAIEIRPVRPLAAKSRYVYVLTRAVHDAGDNPVRAAAELAPALRGDNPDDGLAGWRATLAPVLDHLSTERGIDIDDVVALDVFTTQPTTDDLIAIKDLFDTGALATATPVFENSPIPGLTTGIFPEGTPEFADLVGSPTSDNVAAVAIGSFPSFDFRLAPQMAFDPARVSGQVIPSVNQLDFYMTIPKAPPPTGGYPIVIFGHGLGGSGRNAVSITGLFGDAPMMAIGISAVEHGRRGNVANFFNLVNGFATRDHFRQTVADFLQLERMVRNATVPPFDQVDKSRIEYMGVSLGGIMGTLYMGIEPDVRVGMLSVPGGGLPYILQSEAIGDLLKPLISLTVGIPLNDPMFPAFLHRFIQLSQWVLDAGDPINTAPFVTDPDNRLPGVPAKLILMQEGIVDSVVPNETTDDLALAMDLPDVKATAGCSAQQGCSGIWRFVMTEYGEDEFSGHGVTAAVPQAGEQATRFLLTNGQEIIDAGPTSANARASLH